MSILLESGDVVAQLGDVVAQLGDVVAQFRGCGSSMDRVPDCSPAVPGFDPSLGQIWHPQPWRPSLGKRTRGALNLRQMWKRCADLGRGGGRLSRRRRDNCSESRWRHQELFIRDGLSECGRMWMDV